MLYFSRGRTKLNDSKKIRGSVSEFITNNFLFGDSKKLPASGDSFIGNGILDSTGILELVDFLQKEYGITVEDHETIPDNLDSIDSIVVFVGRKLSA
jgi:acyl carrier protein